VIPLRDANPTRRTPVVTLAIVIACFVAFGVELFALASGGEDALIALIEQHKRRLDFRPKSGPDSRASTSVGSTDCSRTSSRGSTSRGSTSSWTPRVTTSRRSPAA